ncbi:hypothetical protein COX24_02090 [bacterium (Candidatus Gribaldobacteria) CG23_combo_of_CG06-09_8_20_14_all_37_87_8]|uniref:Uncharacterized protein n=2 Tax=Candidatus Gribaldobacteria TaxID=2798536 RepID=A0A2G9ZEW1_9BACT|nr:MAG: hypothetical protein AUJ25_02240 [Parcubacteria group bacterium CG1_02_37_13]PIP31715.1 MAG: hypothetical protein COX24_02090 [bacterium (Candidatus Gribaldobacteria) CG23_combo_of_CG06-09_8_20_14_all_37_87_8]PIR90639.1 MAG: hypothetical protein COU05_01105 [bacterium (Candidatus Gribaldobacteria) CG10_big_fil_rev_8_21_14_0_10_37_21]
MNDIWQKLQKQSPAAKKAVIGLILFILAIPLFILVVYNTKTRMQKQSLSKSPFEGLNMAGLSSGFDDLDQLSDLLNVTTTTTSTLETVSPEEGTEESMSE